MDGWVDGAFQSLEANPPTLKSSSYSRNHLIPNPEPQNPWVVRAPYYCLDLKRDPNLENYPRIQPLIEAPYTTILNLDP